MIQLIFRFVNGLFPGGLLAADAQLSGPERFKSQIINQLTKLLRTILKLVCFHFKYKNGPTSNVRVPNVGVDKRRNLKRRRGQT